MNQNMIGEFIQVSRKEKGLTQKELAEQINVSDKTISKWENGNSTPDTSILSSLCQALDISVNELVSGRKLPPEDYSRKAEENIMTLLEENNNNKKSTAIQCLLGVALFIAAIAVNISTIGAEVGNYIDIISLIFVAAICLAAVLLSGKKDKKSVVRVLRKTVIPAGITVCITGFIAVMIDTVSHTSDACVVGANIAVCVLPILYSAIAYIVFTIIEER